MSTLNIKDPKVHELATLLAKRRGTSATAVVREALEKELEGEPRPIDWDGLRELKKEIRDLDIVWLTDDDLYDDDGLPK